MLFYYESAAVTENNWLHNWFVSSFELCLEAIDENTALPTWDALTVAYVAELRGRWALKQDFLALVEAYRGASLTERLKARQAFETQGNIAKACSTGACLRAKDLKPEIAEAAISLGERLFDLLSVLNVRSAHYQKIWDTVEDNVCPFCALVDLDDPELPSEDLDHYLSRKIYPFAASNLNNLAPMCSRCNMDYKGSKDVIHAMAPLERHYPYALGKAGQVKLTGSTFFVNGDGKPPAWRISLLPDEKAEEWDRIFEIKSRYELTILNKRYMDWLAEWVSVFPDDFEDTDDAIRSEAKRWSEIWAGRGLHDKAFLRAAYLDLVHETLQHSSSISEQLFSVIRSQLQMYRRSDAA